MYDKNLNKMKQLNEEFKRMTKLAGLTEIEINESNPTALNLKMASLNKELTKLYKSGELERVNDEEGLILRTWLIDLLGSMGDDYGNYTQPEHWDKSEATDIVWNKYFE